MVPVKGGTIQITPTEDGLYRATSRESDGLYAEATTPQEAESLLMDMIESRIQAGGAFPRKSPLGDPDAAPEPEEL